MQRHAVHRRCHAMFADAVIDITGPCGHRALNTPQTGCLGVVRPGQVGRGRQWFPPPGPDGYSTTSSTIPRICAWPPWGRFRKSPCFLKATDGAFQLLGRFACHAAPVNSAAWCLNSAAEAGLPVLNAPWRTACAMAAPCVQHIAGISKGPGAPSHRSIWSWQFPHRPRAAPCAPDVPAFAGLPKPITVLQSIRTGWSLPLGLCHRAVDIGGVMPD